MLPQWAGTWDKTCLAGFHQRIPIIIIQPIQVAETVEKFGPNRNYSSHNFSTGTFSILDGNDTTTTIIIIAQENHMHGLFHASGTTFCILYELRDSHNNNFLKCG